MKVNSQDFGWGYQYTFFPDFVESDTGRLTLLTTKLWALIKSALRRIGSA
jgi:hypothetical protein